MIWTDEIVEQLKKMWDKGMTTGQIAKELNVTKNSIIGKVHRLCLTARPSPIKRKDILETTDTKEKQPKTVKEAKSTSTKEKTVKEPKAVKKVEVITEKKSDTKQPVTNKEKKECTSETNIPLVKLDSHTCRWPMGDPKDDDFCFCGKKVKLGQTYCEEHSAIAYVKPNRR